MIEIGKHPAVTALKNGSVDVRIPIDAFDLRKDLSFTVDAGAVQLTLNERIVAMIVQASQLRPGETAK